MKKHVNEDREETFQDVGRGKKLPNRAVTVQEEMQNSTSGIHEIKQHLHSLGHHEQSEESTYRMGEKSASYTSDEMLSSTIHTKMGQ